MCIVTTPLSTLEFCIQQEALHRRQSSVYTFQPFSLDLYNFAVIKRCETKLQKQIYTKIECSFYFRVLFMSYFLFFIRAREYCNFMIHLMCSILPYKVSFLQAAAISCSTYRWFSRYVIAAMLVDENKRFLISAFCSSTSYCTLHDCYLCPWRLVANHL